jgi:hypothetical protein
MATFLQEFPEFRKTNCYYFSTNANFYDYLEGKKQSYLSQIGYKNKGQLRSFRAAQGILNYVDICSPPSY